MKRYFLTFVTSLLLSLLTVSATNVYLFPGANWLKDNAKFGVYYWEGVDNGFSPLMTYDETNDLYKTFIPNGITNVIFIRLAANATAPSFEDGVKWNQTQDLSLNDGNMCVITDWNTGTMIDYVLYCSVDEIMTIYNDLGLSQGSKSNDTYTVHGYVTKWKNGYPQYQNADFYIDESADGSTSRFECFRLSADNESDKRVLQVGEYIEATGKLQNYNGKPELVDGTFHVLPHDTRYTLTVTAGEGGTINSSASGKYDYNELVSVTATPNPGYRFDKWDDGVTDNPRLVRIYGDITIKALFREDYYNVDEIMTIYNNLALSTGGESSNAYTVRGYVTKWKNGYPQYQNADFFIDDSADGSTSRLECFRLTATNSDDQRTLNVGDYIEATAKLKNYNNRAELVSGTFRVLEATTPPPPPTPTYTLSVSAGEGGVVNTSVNGTYDENTKVTLTATPNDGYLFDKWNDGNKDNPRTVTMTKDLTLKALFQKKEEPVDPEEPCRFTELEGKKGNEILTALHAMISEHTVLSYDNIRADKAKVDLRDDGTVWDIYSDCSFAIKSYCGSSTDYVACDCYNREHIVPQSWWGNDNSQPMRFDLYNVYPTDYEANSNRSAWPYGEVSGTPEWSNDLGSKVGYGTWGSSGNNKTFEPADEYKGDIARIYFYMVACYLDKNFTQAGKGYQVFAFISNATTFQYKAKELFLKWHRNDPVSDKEIKRNDAVEKKQGNRNPFVDDPNLAEYIWGKNTSFAYSCSTEEPSAVSNITSDPGTQRASKIIEDGQLFLLLPDGTRYTTFGVMVK